MCGFSVRKSKYPCRGNRDEIADISIDYRSIHGTINRDISPVSWRNIADNIAWNRQNPTFSNWRIFYRQKWVKIGPISLPSDIVDAPESLVPATSTNSAWLSRSRDRYKFARKIAIGRTDRPIKKICQITGKTARSHWSDVLWVRGDDFKTEWTLLTQEVH